MKGEKKRKRRLWGEKIKKDKKENGESQEIEKSEKE